MIKDELPYYTNEYIKEFMSQCDQYQRVEYWGMYPHQTAK